jgi:hypothetical protein
MLSIFRKSTSGYFILLVALTGLALGQAKAPSGILPQSFSGWHVEQQSIKTSGDPAVADPTDSSVLKEYGFTGVETAAYTRNGRTMQIRAARFNDATGAFGAFTYYVQPQMQLEKIGDQGASSNARILFFKGNLLIDVTVEHLTAMSAADLRSLADILPRPKGNIGTLPTLPGNLPSQSLLQNTSRYIVGPEALTRLGVPIPAQLVDFSKGPEVTFGKYRSSQGEAAVTLIGYPTPQIAKERMAAMQSAALSNGPFYFKRTGPFLVAVSGNIPADEAQSLLASVNYDADITWNQPTKPKRVENTAGFIVALILLCVIAVLAALVFGFAFGGVRLLAHRVFPKQVFKRKDEAEIIRLDLK